MIIMARHAKHVQYIHIYVCVYVCMCSTFVHFKLLCVRARARVRYVCHYTNVLLLSTGCREIMTEQVIREIYSFLMSIRTYGVSFVRVDVNSASWPGPSPPIEKIN